MSRRSALVGLLAVVLAGTLGAGVMASKYSPRQYYGNWRKHGSYNYYYRSYYYKPSTSYYGYKHHYAIYYPSKPDYYYYYNPYKKYYWGRCPSKGDGEGVYSLLKEEDRKGSLDEIPEKAFPKPGPLPKIPEATDEATLDLPPDDLPLGEGVPKDRKNAD